MSRTAGTGRSLRRGLGAFGCAVLMMTMAGCAQPEPDEQQVAGAVGKLAGVEGVDASFIGTSMGGAGDQEIKVQVAGPPDPQQVEDLIRKLPKVLQDIEDADGYDEFVITTQTLGENAKVIADSSSLEYGPELTPAGLATRWAKAVATSPPGGLHVQVRPAPRRAEASLSSHDSVSTALVWALSSGLTDLDWTVVEYQTAESPYVRYGSDRPLAAPVVAQWKAIESTFATDERATNIRGVVVEDFGGVRRVGVNVSYPAVSGPLTEAAHGAEIWPVVEAINDSMPADDRLDLTLGRKEEAEQGGAGDGDLVDEGAGSADWEAAYRRRFPDAVTPTATPK